jgi:hypothetical protein
MNIYQQTYLRVLLLVTCAFGCSVASVGGALVPFAAAASIDAAQR